MSRGGTGSGAPLHAYVSGDGVQTLGGGEERGFSQPRPHFSWLRTPLRQLVNAGVLTVRDAGSWWLAVPGAGRFIKCFVKGILTAALAPSPSRTPFGGSSGLQASPFSTPYATSPSGRQAVLGMVRKAKYRELLLSELLGRRPPAAVRLGLAYHVHDLIGAQLVDW